jgi:hypothetical protein
MVAPYLFPRGEMRPRSSGLTLPGTGRCHVLRSPESRCGNEPVFNGGLGTNVRFVTRGSRWLFR